MMNPFRLRHKNAITAVTFTRTQGTAGHTPKTRRLFRLAALQCNFCISIYGDSSKGLWQSTRES